MADQSQNGISQREFAKREGCDEKLVRKALAKGKLAASEDGSIDPGLVGSAWRKRRLATVAAAEDAKNRQDSSKTDNIRRNSSKNDRKPTKFQQQLGDAQLRKEIAAANLRQLEFDEKSGRLIDATKVKAEIFRLAREDRDALANWPAQLAPLLSAEFGVDAAKLAIALEAHVRAFLADRARLHRGD